MRNSLRDHKRTYGPWIDCGNRPNDTIASPAPKETTTVAINDRFKPHCLKLRKDELSIDPFN